MKTEEKTSGHNTDAPFLWSIIVRSDPSSSLENVISRHSRSSMHLLKDPEGWAWEVEALDRARELNADRVEVIDGDTYQVYRTSMENMQRYGTELDRGYGPEIFLPLEHWVVSPYEPQI